MSYQQPTRTSGKDSIVPEISLPSARARLRDNDEIWISVKQRGTRRIYVRRLGPFSLVLLGLGIGVVAALVFVLAIAAFFMWIFVAALLVSAAILSALLRQSLRRWH